jgi:pyruvate formate lyase activating enzyme
MAIGYDIEIKGIVKSSFLDWDGKIVSTLHVPKCNFRCPFCHNWELLDNPQNFESIPQLEIDRHLQANRDFIDGICITGGEPTVYDSLIPWIDHLSSMGIRIKLDTNGTKPKVIQELLEERLVDYIAMDVKAPFDEKYNKLSGVNVNLGDIQNSVDLIMNSDINFEFRTTLVPNLMTVDDILEISESLAGAKKYALQQYVPENARDESLRSVQPFKKDVFENLHKQIKKKFITFTIRGVKY